MRYFIQAAVMFGDVALILVAVFILVSVEFHPISVLIAIALGKAWYDAGGLIAWRPKNIRQFLANAKKYGL